MRLMNVLWIGGLSLLALPGWSADLNADALLAKLDKATVATSSHSVGSIAVEDRFGKKVTGFEAWTSGTEKSLIVFTSGDEKGQKILRLKDTLYVAYPEADKPVKIQGAALKDSVAGSDFSYEDMAGDRSYASRYVPTLKGEEAVAGDNCAVLELKAKVAGLAYPQLRIWVSLTDFTSRKSEEYSQNGRLLKTLEVLEMALLGGRSVAVRSQMTDALRAKSKTQFTVTVSEVNLALPASKFSLEELTF